MIHIALWLLVAWMILGVIAMIAMIGKPRRPLTPSDAVVALLINGTFTVALVLELLR